MQVFFGVCSITQTPLACTIFKAEDQFPKFLRHILLSEVKPPGFPLPIRIQVEGRSAEEIEAKSSLV